MNEHSTFYRKITYLVLIALLLFPIAQLGTPATLEDAGGHLAQLRDEYDLGQADLGDIDPASETIRMATLGLRGIAVSMLWNKATEYKKKEDWTNYRATLNQLAKLQPYFIAFWRFQAWNLTYNVSVELDDVQDRFHYVKRGIEFLKEGSKYNRDSPYLLAELGWFFGNKIGKADEKELYRRMFKRDEDFHNRFFDGNPPPPEMRDNWLVSRTFYNESISAVEDKKKSLGQKNPTTFYANPAMSQMNYGEAIEREGTFGEKARTAWETAARLWETYGQRQLTSSRGVPYKLDDYERLEAETQELTDQLESLAADAREALLEERRSNLTENQRQLVDLPPGEIAEEDYQAYSAAKQQLEIQPLELAEYIAETNPQIAIDARKLGSRIAENSEKLRSIQINRDVSNYVYWKTRAQFEQSSDALRARELAYEADAAFKKRADLLTAKDLYEQSFQHWADVLEAYPFLQEDSTTGSDLMEFVDEYSTVLEQLDLSLADEEIGREFPLWDIVKYNDAERKYYEALEAHERRHDAASLGADEDESEQTEPATENSTEQPEGGASE